MAVRKNTRKSTGKITRGKINKDRITRGKKKKKENCGRITCKQSVKSSNPEEEKMLIANPIYDVVFKYLLDDNKIAKKLLSLIIGKEIITLDYKASEVRNDLESKRLTLLHLDFSALVNLEDGTEQQIIIELQKAKLHTDIIRFRRYLGTQYADDRNILKENGNNKAIPIFSIYILGHCLEHTKVPVIKVDRTYYDAATGEEIQEKEDFIEGLTHDSMIIQVPALKTHRRNLLEKVLSVFQPSKGENKFLNMSEEDYPKEYREVFRRLLQAGAEPEVRTAMILEDEIVAELDDMARKIADKDEALVKVTQEKDEALAEKDEALAEKDKALAKAAQEKIEIARALLDVLDNETIAKKTGLTLAEVEALRAE